MKTIIERVLFICLLTYTIIYISNDLGKLAIRMPLTLIDATTIYVILWGMTNLLNKERKTKKWKIFK